MAEIARRNPLSRLRIPDPSAVALGLLAGWRVLHKFGRNDDVDSAASEDVVAEGGIWNPPDAAVAHTIVSDSADDSASGTGLQCVEVQGLDDDLDPCIEVVDLDGLTPVAIPVEFRRISVVKGVRFGAGSTNAGLVTVARAGPATTIVMPAGFGQSQAAAYTVPRRHTLLITRIYSGIGRDIAAVSSQMEARLMVRDLNAAGPGWRVIREANHVIDGGHPPGLIRPPVPIVGPADVKIQAVGITDNNTLVTGGFDGYLVDFR